MFYVIYGYCGPDNYTTDDGPVLEVKEFRSEENVEKFYVEFMEGMSATKTHVTFRVIQGVERKMKPVETVTKFVLE